MMPPIRRNNSRLFSGVSSNRTGFTRYSGRGLKPSARRAAYLLLETVIATGLLIVGIAVIGSQVSEAEKSVWKMRKETRAILLGEQYIAELDLGLIELDSVDEVQEEDFGPRYPDYGWRLITQETAVDGVYMLTLQVLYAMRDSYDEEEFNFDESEIVYTHYLIRATPQPVDLGAEFGLTEEELTELGEKLANTGIEGLTPENFDPKILAKVDSEQLIEVLPIILDAFGQDVDQLIGQLPPEVVEALRESGVLPDESEKGSNQQISGQLGGVPQGQGNQQGGNQQTGNQPQNPLTGQPQGSSEE